MKGKKLFAIASCLSLLAFFPVSCAPAAAPASPAEPAEAPTQTVPATPVPVARSTTPAPTPKPVVEHPRYGGILTLGNSTDPPSLDPIRESTAALFNIISPAYNGLLQYDPLDNEKIIPDLAERWEPSADGMAYTLYLRKDVKWHDGKPFTSADAVFSVDNQRKLNVRKKDLLTAITSVEAAGEYSMKLSLKYPSASILAMLAVGNMPVAPKHVIESKGSMRNDVVGTGPFKLKSYSVGVSLELLKNKEYFVSGRPYLDGITAYIIKDRGTLLAAFRTGRIKMPVPINSFTPGEAKTVEKSAPQAIAQPFQTLKAAVFYINMTQKPWDDVRVRRAIHLATDRQAALKAVSEGEGTLGGALIAGQWAIPPEELLKEPGYRQPKDADIAEAKRLLAEAGLANGFETRIMARAGLAASLTMAEFMTDQLSKVGVRATLDTQESASFLERIDRGAYGTHTSTGGPDITDPDSSAAYFVKGNRYLIADEKLHQLFEKQGRTTDAGERKRIVLEMQYRVLEVAPYVIAPWFSNRIIFWPEVRNYRAGVGQHNNSKYQDVWLAQS
ncbi:MAG: hypothetical protein HYX92_07390 [Chloroflexi bacterium]|nr:hypothetical protein [Chloroflexota bacterium]